MDELAKGPGGGDLNPLGDLNFTRLWQDFDRLFSQTMDAFAKAAERAGGSLNLGELFPKVDLARRGEEVVATVVVPGARPDSLEVAVTADCLTVRGEAETREGNVRAYRAFHRTVPLPARVRPEAARTEQRPNQVIVRVPIV